MNGFENESVSYEPRLRRPLRLPCTCGQKKIDYVGEGNSFAYLCCVPYYFGDELVAVGPIWLDMPIRAKNPIRLGRRIALCRRQRRLTTTLALAPATLGLGAVRGSPNSRMVSDSGRGRVGRTCRHQG